MSESPRILHVISQLDGYGTARQLHILAREQLAQGHAARLVALGAHRPIHGSWESEGLWCAVLERRWRVDPFAAWRLIGQLQDDPPDLIHAWDADAVGYVAAARLWVGSAPLVATLSVAPPPTTWWIKQIDRLAVGTKELRRQYAARGVADEKLAVVPPAVCLASNERTSRREFLTSLGLAEDTKLIVVVGPLVRAKHLDELIWCFELVRTLNERSVMLLLGDGPERRRLERYARLVSNPAAVRFLGYRDDLARCLSLADVVWHSGQQPSISAAVLESMAGQVPVVASDVPAHRAVIDPDRTGFLAPQGSRATFARHTLRLLEDAELASEIGVAAAEEVSKRFSVAQMTGAYRALYRSALAGNG